MVWCSNCDKEYIEVGTKCSGCGHREYASKVNKPNQHKILNEATVKLREVCPKCGSLYPVELDGVMNCWDCENKWTHE